MVLEAPGVDAVNVVEVLDALADADPRVTLESLVRRAKASPRADRAGAVATIDGDGVMDSPDDPEADRLQVEKHETVADARIEAIATELTEWDGAHEVLVRRRTGVVDASADVLLLVVLAGHRTEAFRAVEDSVDRLKTEVPIFGKGTTAAEEFRVHDTPDRRLGGRYASRSSRIPIGETLLTGDYIY